jgi:hypothetical protein
MFNVQPDQLINSGNSKQRMDTLSQIPLQRKGSAKQALPSMATGNLPRFCLPNQPIFAKLLTQFDGY